MSPGVPMVPEGTRDYLIERRRLLLDEVAVIERQCGVESREAKLKRRIAELEQRLGIRPGA